MKSSKLSLLSKVLIILSVLCLIISLFVPLWRIELNAPQYPEGLALLIYTNNLGGNVDIINGLNHYIGMETLHANNFIEFTILPYIIGAFALLAVLVLFINKKAGLYTWFIAFVLFGIISMADFWRWEYNYGHNLNPNAAIIVPGMAYQPPLIGFKQLLNFGAYSIPDIGGWLIVATGLLILTGVLKELNILKRRKINAVTPMIIIALFVLSCNSQQPSPININKDNCDNCKMSITDAKFGCEVISSKGRVYKFDDIECMQNFIKENNTNTFSSVLVSDFNNNLQLFKADKGYFLKSESIKSPMGGNIAAFASKDLAVEYSKKINASVINWKQINRN